MSYINTVLNFLNANSIIVLSVTFAVVFLFGVVNFITNPYRKQNKKLTAVYKGVFSCPDKVSKHVDKLPEDYRRQWRVVTNCGVKPSLAFEFVKKRKRLHLLWLFVLAAVVSATYIAVFFVTERYVSYLVFQVVFWLAFVLVMLVNKAVKNSQERRARRVLAKLVAQLNSCAPLQRDAVDTTVKQLQRLNRFDVNDGVVQKASELLHSKGLEKTRTVEEQRKINSALNGLLQAYSRSAHLAGGATK